MSENLLRHEASPYLLQHKDNPVHWRPWGPAAFAEASADGKPVLLSIGYAACHWCHVMAHESFEDAATAAVMNRLFVSIKVDREERPEVDQIYMGALHALGEQGGWPLTMFLTPAGEPIWGGTYFPMSAQYGRPAFVDVLEEIARIFHDEPDKVAGNRAYIMERLAAATAQQKRVEPSAQLLDAAARQLLDVMDPVTGGTKGATKFPNAPLLECLWRAGLRTGVTTHRDAVLLTLRSLCQGGIYDHIGGGFSRYSTDARWLVPHFEKMLYDNAQLLELLTFAFLTTRDPLFSDRMTETVDWLEREMLTSGGAFAASLDADSEGHEGKFYVWSKDEVLDVLGAEEGAFFTQTYDITAGGNFEGASIPNRLDHRLRLSAAEEALLAANRLRLRDRRATRVRPATDDKVLADWNGLAIAGLALAGATVDRPHWIGLAERAFAFVTATMMRGDRLAHAWRAGKSLYPGLATDYAAMARAALALHAATLDPQYLARAETLAATARRHHWNDAEPGFFLSADDAEALIIRPRAMTDEATPSATGLMAQNLVRLWRLTGTSSYRDDVDAILAVNAGLIVENLFATTSLQSALDLRLKPVDVVVVAPMGIDPAPLIATARAHWTPNIVLSVVADAALLPPAHPARAKTAIAGKATAYVCRSETCSLPVTEGEGLRELLAASAP